MAPRHCACPQIIRRVYRWAAPVVLVLYIFFDEVSNYHGPEDDNAPTAPNHHAILCRLVLFLTSHLLGSLYLYSGHLDSVIRNAKLSEAEFMAIDRKVPCLCTCSHYQREKLPHPQQRVPRPIPQGKRTSNAAHR